MIKEFHFGNQKNPFDIHTSKLFQLLEFGLGYPHKNPKFCRFYMVVPDNLLDLHIQVLLKDRAIFLAFYDQWEQLFAIFFPNHIQHLYIQATDPCVFLHSLLEVQEIQILQ